MKIENDTLKNKKEKQGPNREKQLVTIYHIQRVHVNEEEKKTQKKKLKFELCLF
jgi:hypothetical protein